MTLTVKMMNDFLSVQCLDFRYKSTLQVFFISLKISNKKVRKGVLYSYIPVCIELTLHGSFLKEKKNKEKKKLYMEVEISLIGHANALLCL